MFVVNSRYAFSSFRSTAVELSDLLGYGAASLDGWCPTFRDIRDVGTSVTIRPTNQRHSPEDLNE